MTSASIRPRPQLTPEQRFEMGRRKRSRTRAMMIRAAHDLFCREDGLSTGIDQICQAAGVSRGTFYNHFDSMDELFGAVAHDLLDDYNVAVTAAISKFPTAAERAATAIRYYLHEGARDHRWAWGMLNISLGGPSFGSKINGYVERTLAEGIDSGELAALNLIAAKDLLIGTGLAAIATQLRTAVPPDYPEEVTRLILRSLGLPPVEADNISRRPLAPLVRIGEADGNCPQGRDGPAAPPHATSPPAPRPPATSLRS